MATGRVQKSVEAGESVHAVAISPDGLQLAADNEQGEVRLWGMETLGEWVSAASLRATRPVCCLASVPESRSDSATVGQSLRD